MTSVMERVSGTRVKCESFKLVSIRDDLLELNVGVLGVAIERRRLTRFLRHHRWLVITTTTTHSAIGIVLKITTAIEDVLRHIDRHGDAERTPA